MISLRKHIDSYQDQLTESALIAFRSALVAMGECGRKAVPATGEDLPRGLAGVHTGLAQPVTPEALEGVARQVRQHLDQWSDRASENNAQNDREIREIMATVTKAAESVGERDQRFARAVGDLAGRLRKLSETTDIAAIRRSIVEETATLKDCVERMANENKTSIAQLTGQVTEYRVRLEKSERECVVDPLTSLANRRAFEERLAQEIERARPFSLILIDMNDFKSVNDVHGHVAGDDLLRSFASELKAQFTPADLVCRWGGDEFAALVAGNLAAAQAAVERVRRWALGEYKIETGTGRVKVNAGASLGAVEWKPRETGVELLARADKSVYREKSTAKSAR